MATSGRIENEAARTRKPQGRGGFALLAALTSLATQGCSGIGEVDITTSPSAVSFAASSFPASETSGAIVVGLVTELPETTEAITVTVSDLGSGTATAGSDYAAFDPFVVTFPAGSVTGDSVTVSLTMLPDTVAEGANETIRFGLSGASNASVVGITQTTVDINDSQTASLSFQTSSTVTPDESSSSYPLTIQLDLSLGATLGFDVNTLLQDDGTGTATAGADYVAVPSTPVQFAAGTPSGAQQQITLQVLDDTDSEGMEFFAVHLTGLGLDQLERVGPTRHILNITDDESAPTAVMSATSGPTGTETTHAGAGDDLQLGFALDGAGPNLGSLLIVTNAGGQPMSLGQPLLSGTNETDFKVEVDGASLPSGMNAASGMTPPSEFADLGAPFVRRDAAALGHPGSADSSLGAGLGLSVTLDEAALVDLSAVDRVRFHGFPLPGNLGEVTLELERIPLPVAADAILFVDGQPIPGGPGALLSDLTTWRGRVVEIPDSTAFLAFNTGVGPRGFIQLPFGENSMIHIASEAPSTGSMPATSRIIHESELAGLPASERPALCGGQLYAPGTAPRTDLASMGYAPLLGALDSGFTPPTGSSPGTSSTVVANCRLALETDFQLYQKLGSSAALTEYVTSLVAAISDQYFEDAQVTLSIAYLGIHTTSNDGWTTPDGPGTASDMLAEFRTAWNTSGWPATADLAHFLSGASLGGGVAYVDVLCHQTYGYGVSGNLNGLIDWQTWTGNAGSFTWDFVVFAHELGHNFGTTHTHEYCPPLDHCYAGCESSTQCSQGTIMSYCHTCGGMDNIDLHFHPVVSDVMRTEIQNSCLGDALMQAGNEIRYRLRFDPRSGTGAKSATLRFTHDAPNAPNPFDITLRGTAN
ncbi:Calx-beta domain protein [Planctomycetes bacterium Poly30]|uniref:Calx-beta domain protein n=1 Tax=Saltatorellus ferox TaxID=2528018 RepID=A0A518F0W7_9BACT|nr:Calx-beta domain protein [Planctomycetes bacterium Poly30]